MLRASKRASEVNMQREKNKREERTANNWPLTFQFGHSVSWTLLFGATCVATILSVIIAPLENTRKPKRGLSGHPQRPRRTEK